MLRKIFFSVVILSIVNEFQAQQPLEDEECPEFEFNKGIDMVNDKLTGVWYLHASIPRFYEVDMKCTFINVTILGEDHLHFVKHEFHNGTNEHRETFGTVEFTREGSTSIFYTDLHLPFDFITIGLTPDYWVIVTCSECGFFSEEGAGSYAYVFTRLQYPPCELNEGIMKLLKENHIKKTFVLAQEQNNCPFC